VEEALGETAVDPGSEDQGEVQIASEAWGPCAGDSLDL